MLVKFFATYRKISGVTSTSVEAPSDVLALLRELSERWPAFRDLFLDETGEKIGDDVIVMVNARSLAPTNPTGAMPSRSCKISNTNSTTSPRKVSSCSQST